MTEPPFVMRSRPVIESLARPSEQLDRRLAVVDADLAEVMAPARLPIGSRRVNRLAERLGRGVVRFPLGVLAGMEGVDPDLAEVMAAARLTNGSRRVNRVIAERRGPGAVRFLVRVLGRATVKG
jgi:hypothetical protein